jgi:hypothetical protein
LLKEYQKYAACFVPTDFHIRIEFTSSLKAIQYVPAARLVGPMLIVVHCPALTAVGALLATSKFPGAPELSAYIAVLTLPEMAE